MKSEFAGHSARAPSERMWPSRPAEIRTSRDYFHEERVRILADGDAAALERLHEGREITQIHVEVHVIIKDAASHEEPAVRSLQAVEELHEVIVIDITVVIGVSAAEFVRAHIHDRGRPEARVGSLRVIYPSRVSVYISGHSYGVIPARIDAR